MQGASGQVKERMEKVAAGEPLRPVLLFPEVTCALTPRPFAS